MSSVRKYVLTPFESETSSTKTIVKEARVTPQPAVENKVMETPKQKNSTNLIKERARIRIENMLKIISKLALINGFDSDRRIRSSSGKYLTNTDVIDLVIYAMQPGKLLVGEDEFVSLLKEANIDANWLFNENLKAKILRNKYKHESEDRPVNLIKQVEEEPMFAEKINKPVEKRKHAEDEIEQSSKKRKLDNWTYSDDE